MWRKILAAIAIVLTLELVFELARKARLARDEQARLQSQIESLRQRLTQVDRELNELKHELTRLQDTAKHDREIAALKLENELLKFERRLPVARLVVESICLFLMPQ